MTTRKHIAPYPISLNLEGSSCLVVGGGTVAFRKIESLLAAGARVKVVAPQMLPEIEEMPARGDAVELVRREFQPEDLDGNLLVICATNQRPVNEAVARAAKQRLMLVNVVDVPDLCNFYVNSLVHRGDLAISISTGGASPALSKRIRKELEERYGEEYAAFLELMREYRPRIIERVPDPQVRQRVFEELVAAGIEEILREKGTAAAREAFDDVIGRNARAASKKNRYP